VATCRERWYCGLSHFCVFCLRISGPSLRKTTSPITLSSPCCTTLCERVSRKGLTRSRGSAPSTRPGCTFCCWRSQVSGGTGLWPRVKHRSGAIGFLSFIKLPGGTSGGVGAVGLISPQSLGLTLGRGAECCALLGLIAAQPAVVRWPGGLSAGLRCRASAQ